MSSSTEIILQMISNIPIYFFIVCCWKKCLGQNIRERKIQTVIVIIIMNVIVALLNYFFPKSIRIFAIFIPLIIINYFSYSKSIRKSILLVLISQIVLWISEFSFVIIASLFLKENTDSIMNTLIGFISLNIYITIVSFIFLKLKVPTKIYNILSNALKSIANNETMLYLIMIMFIIVISTIEGHMNLPMPVLLTTNTIMGIIYIIIILKFTSMKSNYNKVNNKYQTSINSLKEYESMIDKFRVNNHENKNELMTIRNMVNDKKTIEYIDKLVDNKIKDNERIMYKTSKIPEGGLRATIYSKLCVMDEYNIKYTLDIANDVRTVDLINLGDELILNVCKILGVFLDNAIDAVKNLKNKTINIEFYIMDENLCIDITNNFKGNMDLNKLGSQQYTTKGEGHGYGLLLVNRIIRENNEILENEKSINSYKFTQTLKIKM